jgi:hypothetical protein
MSQIVHCPAVFDDEEWYPFGDVLCNEDPDSENQGERFDDPKDRVEGLFVAGLCLVIGDVSQELPHEVDLAGETPLPTLLAEVRPSGGKPGARVLPAGMPCHTISQREAPFLAKPPVISGGAVQADPFFDHPFFDPFFRFRLPELRPL